MYNNEAILFLQQFSVIYCSRYLNRFAKYYFSNSRSRRSCNIVNNINRDASFIELSLCFENIKTIISAIATQSFVIYFEKQKSSIRLKASNASNERFDSFVLDLEISI